MEVRALCVIDNFSLVVASNIFNIDWPTISLEPHPEIESKDPKLEEVIILKIEKDSPSSEGITISGECKLNGTEYNFVTYFCFLAEVAYDTVLEFTLTDIEIPEAEEQNSI